MTTPVAHGWGNWFYQKQSSPHSTTPKNQITSEKLAKGRHHYPIASSSSWRILSLFTKALCIQCAMGHIPIPDMDRGRLHPRELKAVDSSFSGFFESYRTAQEWLRFRQDDPREKLLYLTADSDWNGALDPSGIYHIVSELNKRYDIKYKVITNYQDVCQQVKEAASFGKLAHVFINGHGNPNIVHLSEEPLQNVEGITKNNDFSCFSDLAVNGKIGLISCSTGKPQEGDPYMNIAQVMATGARRTVVAATDLLFSTQIKEISADPLMFLHKPTHYEGKWHFTNFSVFYPRFPSCQGVTENESHPRERAVINAVSANLIARNFLWDRPTFAVMQDYLRLCKDNPKRKFIVLSSKEENCAINDPNMCSHNPVNYAKFLTDIAEHFDLKFKVIERENDVCTEVRSAAQVGEIAAVLIHAAGNLNRLQLSNEELPIGFWQRISEWYYGKPTKFPRCLAEIPPKARIFLAGGSTGSSQNGDDSDNLASKIAGETNRVVFAPSGPIYSSKLVLTSANPVEIYHPTPHQFLPFTDSGENIFKMFHGQKNK